MMVMPSNLVGMAAGLEAEFPTRLGLFFSPGGLADPRGLPTALDNGRYAAWSKGKAWRSSDYLTFLDRALRRVDDPVFAVVPDVVGDGPQTLKWWSRWEPRLSRLGLTLALAVQDGMTPESVHREVGEPAVVFVGGTTRWKWETVRTWTKSFRRVHVGRVNTLRRLWLCHALGVESCDGTGWYYRRQRALLRRYLLRSSVKTDSFFWNNPLFEKRT